MRKQQTWIQRIQEQTQKLRRERRKGQNRSQRQIYINPKLFPGITVKSEFMQTKRPPRRWAVDGLIPDGLTILAAGKSIGKTWLSLNIALDIAEGRPVLGKIPAEQGPVLYLSLEANEALMQDKLEMLQGEHTGVPDDFCLMFQTSGMDGDLLETLERWAQTYPTTRLIVIDLLAKIKPKQDQRGTLYDIEYQIIDRLVTVANRTKMAILLLHHTNQRSEEQLNDTFDSVGGSTGLLAPAAAVMKLRRKRYEKVLTLDVSGKGLIEHVYTLERDEQWRITLKDEPPSPPKPAISPERRAILDVCAKRPYKPAAVAEILKRDGDATRVLMNSMAKDGQLVRLEDGTYSTL